MKKQIITISTAFLFALGSTVFISCGEGDAHQHETHESAHETDAEENSEEHVHYQCPMDCEEGKTYEEPGSCPVCGMDLKELEG